MSALRPFFKFDNEIVSGFLVFAKEVYRTDTGAVLPADKHEVIAGGLADVVEIFFEIILDASLGNDQAGRV